MKLWCENQAKTGRGEVLCLAMVRGNKALPCPYKTREERDRAGFPCADCKPISQKRHLTQIG